MWGSYVGALLGFMFNPIFNFIPGGSILFFTISESPFYGVTVGAFYGLILGFIIGYGIHSLVRALRN